MSTKRVRTVHFVVSSAAGGLVGFVLMEALPGGVVATGGTRSGNIFEMGVYFAGFGLAVGAALGMTEGLVRRNRRRAWYGLGIGLLLGGIGGFVGGASGQAVYGLVPLRYAGGSTVDLVIALDASSSMGRLLFGSDPRGRRKAAAKRVVERMSPNDRVAVVDFNAEGRVLLPLTSLATSDARREVRRAIDAVGSGGGTSLDAGLAAAFSVLRSTPGDGRDRHVIFMTDGQGEYTPERFGPEVTMGVTVHTVGLGDGVDAGLLHTIAASTGGDYYAASRASDLIAVFDDIFTEHVVMTAVAPEGGAGELLTPGWVLLLVRTLGWAVMGTLLGMGQGLSYNTREDFRACALGGLAGGAVGGALLHPLGTLTGVVGIGAGLPGRAIADVVVGAMIGGSMKLTQGSLVDPGQTTALLAIRPDADGGIMDVADRREGGLRLRQLGGIVARYRRREGLREVEEPAAPGIREAEEDRTAPPAVPGERRKTRFRERRRRL